MADTGALSVVVRQELFELLSDDDSRRVTLISAPAGSGKTYLLRSWIEATGLRDRVAWVSVERDERDAQHFWRSVVGALRSLAGAQALVGGLEPTPAFDGEVVVERLISELSLTADEVMIVIDDLHELRSAEAVSQLERLISRRPPLLRVLLASRHDPRLGLHRLRVAGELTEIRAEDLRFSLEEARALLIGARIVLSDESLASLYERTEGWAAGLQLAALALSGNREPDRFVAEFSGSERTVADYLFAEVLQSQPEESRRVLLRTSILEHVNGALADALAGVGGSRRILQELEDQNAFVFSVDASRSWFRYHHLFADLLRLELERAEPDLLPDLHRRAADWFEAHDDIVSAVRHAQAGEDWSRAARLLADHSLRLTLDGRGETVDTLVGRFPPSNLSSDPELARVAAAAAILRGSLADAGDYLALAERGPAVVSDERRPRFEVLVGITRLMLARRRGDFDSALAEAQPLLADEMASAGEPWRGDDLKAAALMHLGIVELWSDRYDEAERHLEQGLVQARRAGRSYLELQCLAHLAVAAGPRSFLAAREHAVEAITIAESHDWGTDRGTGVALVALAAVDVWQGRFDDGEDWLRRAELAVDSELEPAAGVFLYHTRGRLLMARGRNEEAVEAFRAAAEIERMLVSPHRMGAATDRMLASAQLRLGEMTAARATLSELRGRYGNADVIRVAEAQLFLEDGDARAAVDVLAPILDGSAPSFRMRLVEAMLVDAIARDRLGEADAAESDIERALELAEPEAMIWPFVVTAVGELLDRHPRHRTAHGALLTEILHVIAGSPLPAASEPAALQEELTDSELRVLRYLPSNLSASEIGSQLFISQHTVKTHIRHIYAKLGVHRRSEAVARARQLGLLASSRVR